MAEYLPFTAAVECCRFIIHGWNILQAGQINDHRDADVLPAVDQCNDDLAARSVCQPIDRVFTEILEDLIDDAVVELEEEIHDVAHQKARDHDRQIDNRPDSVADLEFAVEEQRQRQTEHVLQQRRAEAIEHGVPERGLKVFICKQVKVVFQSDKGHILGISIPLEEGDIYAPRQGV